MPGTLHSCFLLHTQPRPSYSLHLPHCTSFTRKGNPDTQGQKSQNTFSPYPQAGGPGHCRGCCMPSLGENLKWWGIHKVAYLNKFNPPSHCFHCFISLSLHLEQKSDDKVIGSHINLGFFNLSLVGINKFPSVSKPYFSIWQWKLKQEKARHGR